MRIIGNRFGSQCLEKTSVHKVDDGRVLMVAFAHTLEGPPGERTRGVSWHRSCPYFSSLVLPHIFINGLCFVVE